MIAIIDYGAGNIQSVSKALRHIGCDCIVTRDKEEIMRADGAVLTVRARGLGVFDGSITRIPGGEGLKIPHMGWNSLEIKKHARLFKGIEGEPYVYFVHSYYLTAADPSIVAAQTRYGVTIDAAVEQGNVFATQFHPEKSGDVGLQILRNFAEIVEGN